ncbi:MAG: hypothetical protein WAQ52_07855 [Terriglobales bacterium]
MADIQPTLTHEQILERFRKMFGREMPPEERRVFFLPEPPDEEGDKAG